jgi:hypothetical protein
LELPNGDDNNSTLDLNTTKPKGHECSSWHDFGCQIKKVPGVAWTFTKDIGTGAWGIVTGAKDSAEVLSHCVFDQIDLSRSGAFNSNHMGHPPSPACGQIWDGLKHTVTHPGDLIRLDDILHGHPGRAVPDILLWAIPAAKLIDAIKAASAARALKAVDAVAAAGGADAAAEGALSTLDKALLGEEALYEHALDLGEKPLSAPHNVSAHGPDLVTYDPVADEIVVWDAKYRSTGSFPKSIPAETLAGWQPYIDQAVNNYDGIYADLVEDAVSEGRVVGRIFPWPPR